MCTLQKETYLLAKVRRKTIYQFSFLKKIKKIYEVAGSHDKVGMSKQIFLDGVLGVCYIKYGQNINVKYLSAWINGINYFHNMDKCY